MPCASYTLTWILPLTRHQKSTYTLRTSTHYSRDVMVIVLPGVHFSDSWRWPVTLTWHSSWPSDPVSFLCRCVWRKVHVCIRDAAWEMESDAFVDQLERHSHCDVTDCRCPHGRAANLLDTSVDCVISRLLVWMPLYSRVLQYLLCHISMDIY